VIKNKQTNSSRIGYTKLTVYFRFYIVLIFVLTTNENKRARIRTPDLDDFQNFTGTSLSEDTSVRNFSKENPTSFFPEI